MTIAAKILADSISPEGVRLTTMQVTLHRFVLAELGTHRAFSRSFRSSRAVPVKTLLDEVRTNPAMPVQWGSNKPGMQAGEELTNGNALQAGLGALDLVQDHWRKSAQEAALRAELMMNLGLHKQVANRVLEPYLYVHGVVTATEWDNFYKLRRHPDAQPEIKALADAMWEAQQASVPEELQPGEWHLPYINEEDEAAIHDHLYGTSAFHGSIVERMMSSHLALVSAARCARVSYKPFEGEGSIKKDLELADKLLASGHASPFEHQATPDSTYHNDGGDIFWKCPTQHRNFRGWRQQRALVEL